MLKISVLESRTERRLILEGKLLALWVSELRTACERAAADLDGRELVIDLKNLTAISQEGEDVLLDLMNDRIRFRDSGVFTKELKRPKEK